MRRLFAWVLDRIDARVCAFTNDTDDPSADCGDDDGCPEVHP